MTDTKQDVPTQAREALKEFTPPEFLKQYTRDDMNGFAEQLGVDESEHRTKSDLYNALVGAADLPDPTLRGNSEIDSPVARVWVIADQMWAEALANGEKPRRKDVVQRCQDEGVAYYTARTQYQAWYKATNGGESLVKDNHENIDLPRAVAELYEPVPVEEPAESEEAEA